MQTLAWKLTPDLETLHLTQEERRRLAKACPYFPESYLDFLQQLRLNPREQVRLTFVEKEGGMGEIECEIKGPWRDCIMYEIPIMATSELACLGES